MPLVRTNRVSTIVAPCANMTQSMPLAAIYATYRLLAHSARKIQTQKGLAMARGVRGGEDSLAGGRCCVAVVIMTPPSNGDP